MITSDVSSQENIISKYFSTHKTKDKTQFEELILLDRAEHNLPVDESIFTNAKSTESPSDDTVLETKEESERTQDETGDHANLEKESYGDNSTNKPTSVTQVKAEREKDAKSFHEEVVPGVNGSSVTLDDVQCSKSNPQLLQR